ncbi:oxidoreductase C-terminal domain-containing protein [Leucobacter tenebrionis]|uniref:oxidoreductase C-terminal domain-containing protein n=1 Tax=Leucobacter tenebrionis TaxID=2873270 RepID=UPI001CA6034D|nr:oxidoreductase C-terminal domain-containing protein [Leucobacter tenebrionis]QZY50643.1 FAD-dependent oxidoreductase [Leucobacter tenebrionis]
MRGIRREKSDGVTAILGRDGWAVGVELADGERIAASGIVVDGNLRMSDEGVFAIGDCARYPNRFAGTEMRVESVQNATDHARHVAAVLTGAAESDYRSVLWFWSTQGDRRLQIAGIAMPDDEARPIEQGDDGKLVVERWRAGRLVAVETINAPGPHMPARRALA